MIKQVTSIPWLPQLQRINYIGECLPWYNACSCRQLMQLRLCHDKHTSGTSGNVSSTVTVVGAAHNNQSEFNRISLFSCACNPSYCSPKSYCCTSLAAHHFCEHSTLSSRNTGLSRKSSMSCLERGRACCLLRSIRQLTQFVIMGEVLLTLR